MSNTDKFMLVFLATLIIYLAIILPIRLCVVSFSWHWFVFGLIAVVIPFAFIHFQLWSQKKLSFTDEQKKNANVVTVKYILYFWFLDCLYMAIFNQWILWIYILGIITLIKIFYGLTVTFLGKKQKNAILDISIVFDFLLGIGLTVYLIYLIPDKFINLQTIVTAMIGRKELSRMFVALIAVHEQFAEIIVEFTVVVHDGREQGEEIGKEFDNQFLFVGFVSVDDLQIPLFAFVKLCFIHCIGNGDRAAFEKSGKEHVFIYLIHAPFYFLDDAVEGRDRIRTGICGFGGGG